MNESAGLLGAVWDFLRDPENRGALTLVGQALAAIVFALWVIWRERKKTEQMLKVLDKSQVDFEDRLRKLEIRMDSQATINDLVRSELDRHVYRGERLDRIVDHLAMRTVKLGDPSDRSGG